MGHNNKGMLLPELLQFYQIRDVLKGLCSEGFDGTDNTFAFFATQPLL
jgi:hypothetical protein